MAISKEKSERIQNARRKQILDTAMVLFDKQGYTNTKISDISEKAGISKGLIYRYFISKEEILLGLSSNIEACVEECQEIESAEEAIRTFILRLLSYPYYQGYIPPMRIFFTAMIKNEIHLGQHLNPFREEWGREYFGAIFKRGQDQGCFRQGDPMAFGDFLWKYLLGSLSLLCQQDEKKANIPDCEQILGFFR